MADEGFAVTVFRDEGRWHAEVLPRRLVGDLDALVAAVRQQPGEGGALGLVDVADEFFVAVRVMPSGDVRVLLSDVTAAVAWDLARQALEHLGEDVPGDEELDDVWPIGDLGLFADLGLDEMELGAILADLDMYADEMLLVIARRAGFAEAYEQILDALPR